MSFIKSKKGIATLATLVVVGVSAFGAYAYFTSTGKTNATPVTAGTSVNLTVAENSAEVGSDPAASPTTYECLADPSFDTGCQLLLPTSLNDGNAPVGTVNFTITNNDESTEQLTSYTIAIQNANGSAWSSQTNTSLPACTASDFSIDGQAAGAPFVSSAGSAGQNPTDFTGAVTGVSPVSELKPLSDAPNNTFGSSFTVRLVDNTLNQNNCEGVTPNIEISTTSA